MTLGLSDVLNILVLASARMRAWSEPSVTSRVSNHSAFVASEPALGKATLGSWVA